MIDYVAVSKPVAARGEVNPGGHDLPLIVTKIRTPRRRPDLLYRPRLVNFIHAHLDRRLILLSAPAGYGKTSLLIDFAHDTDLPVCWFTLDPFDRDLRVFLEYLISAIALRFPAFGGRSRAFLREVADPTRSLYPMVATLVQEIYDAIPEYFVLILDDHHAVAEQEGPHEFLDLLVKYVGENCHLIIASRALPALPHLPLLVAGRQATGLSLNDLRFNPQEIRALARQNHGRKLSVQQASKLAEQTGGWIMGLLLTAAPHWEGAEENILIQGRINVGLYDYLSQQVLDRQPAALRDFLLASSVLDELDPALCSAALGLDEPAALMEQVRTRSLFVIGFEGDDDRLRYHDLFREFLRATLRRQDAIRYRNLIRRAAEVHAARGEWEQAVDRYLELAEYRPVAEIIERTATYMYETGHRDALAGWIDALPEEMLAAHPRFRVVRGKIHTDRAEHAAAMDLYNQAERAFFAADDKPWAAFTLATKGSLLRFQGRYGDAVKDCRKAVSLVSGDTVREKFTLALAHRNVGLCQLRLGQVAAGLEALRQALDLYEGLEDSYDIGMVHHDLGLGHELAGDIEQAVGHYRAALQRWRQIGNLGTWAHTLNNLGVICSLQGDYDKALQLLNDAFSKVQKGGNPRAEAAIWASLGDLHRDLGAYEQARQAYTEGLRVATQVSEGFVITYTLDALGNICRLQGNRAGAREQLQKAIGCAEKHDSAYEIGLCHTSLGILASEEGNLAAARQQLGTAVQLFESGGFKRDLARAHLHRAQASFLAGEWDEALTGLERTLTLVDQLGYDGFLVVDGLPLCPLLRYAAGQGVRNDVLPDLLERIEAREARLARQPEPTVRATSRHALKIRALGLPRVELDGKPVRWPTLQSRDLFFCLLQHPLGLRKERVGEFFWPAHDPYRLNGIFHSTVYRLRRALFRESIVYEDELYRFDRESDYWFDVEDFDRLLEKARQEQDEAKAIALLEEALDLYGGDYVEGFYADWCVQERERLRERYLAALTMLAGLYVGREALAQAIELYQRLLAQDPYREIAHRELMRCYHRLGDRAAAIWQYQTCSRILREELGLSPMPETEDLYRQIIG
jgi:LuxR family maltose regulon positive regulatory protein